MSQNENRLWRMERLAQVAIGHTGLGPDYVQSFFCSRPGYKFAYSTPPTKLGAGGSFDPLILSTDDVAYGLDVVKFIVSDMAGTNVIAIAVTANVDVAETDTSTTLPFAGTTAEFAAVGTDLALVTNSGAMRITSTAGGVFVATIEFTVADDGE